MEAPVVLAFVGTIVAAAVIGLWSGVSMVAGLPMPDQQQVKGAMLVGFFGMPLSVGLIGIIMSAIDS